MPLSTDLTDTLIALIPEDGSRISNGEIKAALEQEVGEPLSDAQVEEAKNLVVAMGAAVLLALSVTLAFFVVA